MFHCGFAWINTDHTFNMEHMKKIKHGKVDSWWINQSAADLFYLDSASFKIMPVSVAIQIFPGLLTDALRLEQVGKKLGSRRASTPGGLVREGQQIFWKRHPDLHGVHDSTTGIPEYSVCSCCIEYRT